MDDLERLRAKLNELDRRILDTVAERQAVVDEIGAVKRDSGTATRDFAREKQVIDSARNSAADLGLPPALAETLMETLIRSSLTKQERERVRAEGKGRGRRALVIGGAGQMGVWFVDFLDSQGFDVTVVSTGQHRELVAQVQELFGLAPDLDLDVITLGPVIEEISHAFDDYWNDPSA